MIKRIANEKFVNFIKTWLPEFDLLYSPIIAGGFIRSYYSREIPNDMDLYFYNNKDFEKSKKKLIKLKWELIYSTNLALTLKKDNKLIQLIKPNSDAIVKIKTPEDLIESFDFTVCQACFFKKEKGLNDILRENDDGKDAYYEYFSESFFEDLASKTLIYTGSEMPLSSLKRAIKYTKKGFYVSDRCIIKIVKDLYEKVNFENEDEVQRQILGMDPQPDNI